MEIEPKSSFEESIYNVLSGVASFKAFGWVLAQSKPSETVTEPTETTVSPATETEATEPTETSEVKTNFHNACLFFVIYFQTNYS